MGKQNPEVQPQGPTTVSGRAGTHKTLSPIYFDFVGGKFTFPPTVQEGSLFSTPSPAFIVCRFFDDGHPDQCEVIPHCSFDLHFSNN